jgi:hypothetical protein
VLRRREKRWAAIFADDLLPACEALLAAYGGGPSVTLPISIPIDARGVVLLRPEGPLDAPRVPATLRVERTAHDRYTIAIERQDGGPIVIPGICDADSDATLRTLVADLTSRGLVLSSGPLAISHDEETARSYANALFLTLRRKLPTGSASTHPPPG